MRYFFSLLSLVVSATIEAHGGFNQDCFILDYQTNIKIEKGKLIDERTIVIQINNKNAEWISNIRIPYKDSDKLEIVEAAILDLNNTVERKLKKKDIVTRNDLSYNTFYQDRLVKDFKLKWSKYPYRIRYTYRRTSNQFLSIAYWKPIIYLNVPVANAVLNIQIPKGHEVYKHFSESLEMKQNSTEDVDFYSWSSNYIDVAEKEVFGQNVIDLIPQVIMVPKNFDYDKKGSFESWKSFGAWQAAIIEDMDQLSEIEKMKVDKLIAGMSDKKLIAKTLYNYLQDNTRYINVSIDEGGMVPYPASYVCERKYGDCKALTIYMKALLKYAGIESYYTLIDAGKNPNKFIRDFPSQQFNHVILVVPIENDTIWLENTSSHTPFNYLGTFTQNRNALLVKGAESAIIRTPALSIDDVAENCEYVFSLNSDGAGELTVSKEVIGPQFENIKYIHEELHPKEQDRQYRNAIPHNKIYDLKCQVVHKERDEPSLSFNATSKIEDYFRNVGSSKVISIFPLYSMSMKNVNSRNGEIKINYPINKRDKIVYIVNFEGEFTIPSKKTISSKFGCYEVQYELLENRVIASRKFQLLANSYSKEEYPEFYSFIETISKLQEGSNIIIKPK